AYFVVGRAGSFSIKIAGSPVPQLSESGRLPPGLEFRAGGDGTGTISGTPWIMSIGTYSVTLTAKNTTTDAVQKLTIVVGTSPFFFTPHSASFTAGHQGSFVVCALGYPFATITEKGPLPKGLTFSDEGFGTAKVEGTPAAGSTGTYELTLTAANGVASVVQSLTVIVGQGPGFTSGDSATMTVGKSSSVTVTTSGYPAPSIAESGSLPKGVSFHTNHNGTAAILGTPSEGTAGNYEFTLTAQNGFGNPVVQRFRLTVDE
ncbi:MAG: Ig domain-containing protein, partial [Acidimicrobiales bacterium]